MPRAAEVYCSSYIILDATTTVFIIVVFRRARAFRTDVAKKTKRKVIKKTAVSTEYKNNRIPAPYQPGIGGCAADALPVPRYYI